MLKSALKDLPVYKFEIFNRLSSIEHFVTSREYHNKETSMDGFNLSYTVNDSETHVTENRNILAKNLGIPSNKLFIPKQTHSSHIAIINSSDEHITLDDTDALITARPGICIAVMSADCVPLLIYDYKNKVAASIHAGWKGTVGEIVTKAIELMILKFGAEPKNMIAGIGPSICEKVYEVGNEVADQFEHFDSQTKSKIVLTHPDAQKKYLNLQYANKYQLLSAGIKDEHIETANICTYTNHTQFYSARYFKNNCGRFATGIMIK